MILTNRLSEELTPTFAAFKQFFKMHIRDMIFHALLLKFLSTKLTFDCVVAGNDI